MAGRLPTRYPVYVFQAVLLLICCSVLPGHVAFAMSFAGCPAYSDLHGSLTASSMYKMQIPKCHAGHHLVPHLPSMCGHGTWIRFAWCSFIPNYCKRKSIPGGYIPDGLVHRQATIRCSEGYTLKGGQPFTCYGLSKSAGVWRGGAGVCSVNTCPIPLVVNGVSNATTPTIDLGQTVTFSCKNGYMLRQTRAAQITSVCTAASKLDYVPTCSDVDECARRTHDCHRYATCTNTVGSFNCACKQGYPGNGKTCAVKNCTIPQVANGVSSVAAPTIDVGQTVSFFCNRGYKRYPERATWASVCTNRSRLDYVPTCTDVDECVTSRQNCDPHAACTNTIGSYICKCNDGYSGNGSTCAVMACKVPQVLNGVSNVATSNVAVGQTVTFSCNPGYKRYPPRATGISMCTAASTRLINVPTCTDADECATFTNDCDTHAACTNTIGSFTCECNKGFTGNGKKCTMKTCPIPQVANAVPNVASPTIPFGKSVTYSCKMGYTLYPPGATGVAMCTAASRLHILPVCIDVDECTTGAHNCHKHAGCSNKLGSFKCGCFRGYLGNGISCKVTTCLITRPANGHVNVSGYTVNFHQAVSYSCNTGYRLIGSSGARCSKLNHFTASLDANTPFCQNIVECDTPSVHGCHRNAICADTPGSYSCTCRTGYTGNGTHCQTIPIYCPRQSVNNGYIRAGTISERASVQCNDGYARLEMYNYPYTCREVGPKAGQWQHGFGMCEAIPDYCKRMDVPRGYVQAGQLNWPGFVRCNFGYAMTDGAQYTCTSGGQTSGRWTGGRPSCKPVADYCRAMTVKDAKLTYGQESALQIPQCYHNKAFLGPGYKCQARSLTQGVWTGSGQCIDRCSRTTCHANATCTATGLCRCNLGHTTTAYNSCSRTPGYCRPMTLNDSALTHGQVSEVQKPQCLYNKAYFGNGYLCQAKTQTHGGWVGSGRCIARCTATTCHAIATCNATDGLCHCNPGYKGDGYNMCTIDHNYCVSGELNDAMLPMGQIFAVHTPHCLRNKVYFGNGYTCRPHPHIPTRGKWMPSGQCVERCSLTTSSCHANAACNATRDTCDCNPGYKTNGYNNCLPKCSGISRCPRLSCGPGQRVVVGPYDCCPTTCEQRPSDKKFPIVMLTRGWQNMSHSLMYHINLTSSNLYNFTTAMSICNGKITDLDSFANDAMYIQGIVDRAAQNTGNSYIPLWMQKNDKGYILHGNKNTRQLKLLKPTNPVLAGYAMAMCSQVEVYSQHFFKHG